VHRREVSLLIGHISCFSFIFNGLPFIFHIKDGDLVDDVYFLLSDLKQLVKTVIGVIEKSEELALDDLKIGAFYFLEVLADQDK